MGGLGAGGKIWTWVGGVVWGALMGTLVHRPCHLGLGWGGIPGRI